MASRGALSVAAAVAALLWPPGFMVPYYAALGGWCRVWWSCVPMGALLAC